LNQLVEVKEGWTTVATFEYDGKGRRTEKTTGSLIRTYIYDAEDIVEERITGSIRGAWRFKAPQHPAIPSPGASGMPKQAWPSRRRDLSGRRGVPPRERMRMRMAQVPLVRFTEIPAAL